MIKFKYFFLVTSILLLAACSSKPNDVSQEIWDRGIQYTIYVNKLTQNGENIPEEFGRDLSELIETDADREIAKAVNKLSINSLLIGLNELLGKDTDEAKKAYDETYKELQETFGKNALKESNLDMKLIEGYVTANQINAQEEKKEKEDEFMKSTGVYLTAKEVQYDLVNNLDKQFYVAGNVKLCDYYNYGYTNEEKYFCGMLTPEGGSYSDSWYLYFHRESFKSVYEYLLNSDINLRIIAEVNGKVYKRGQGNMAVVKTTEGY